MININGQLYEEIDLTSESYTFSGRGKFGKMALVMAAMSGAMMGENNYQRKFPSVDIVKEFELIQKKQSTLCRAHRQHVEYLFNKNFKKVSNEPKT